MFHLAFATVMWIDAWKWGLEIRMTKRNGSTFLDFLLFSTILFSEFENKLLKALENDSETDFYETEWSAVIEEGRMSFSNHNSIFPNVGVN